MSEAQFFIFQGQTVHRTEKCHFW